MDNMTIYNKYSEVPREAQKKITGGRLNGMTDINPMWRIRSLTEAFGPCGIGWYTEITEKRIERGANDEMVALVDVNLYVKVDGEWSKPIQGTGGAAFVAKERNGLYTSDEAFKMAYTDALSVCCKLLGFGAHVYWDGGRTKYSQPAEPKPTDPQKLVCENCHMVVFGYAGKDGKPVSADRHIAYTQKRWGKTLCVECAKKAQAANDNAGN